MIRLVLSDIDGTLLPFHELYIDDGTKDAIRGLEAAGITFGAASGRPVSDIDKAFNEPGFSSTCIASDGLVVLSEGKVVLDRKLPNDQLQRMADGMGSQERIALGVCYNERNDPKQPMIWASVALSEPAKAILAPHIKYFPSVPDLDRVPDRNIYVSGMFGPRDDSANEEIVRFVAEKTDTLHALRTAPGYFDVCLRDWNKAKGAKALLDYLGYGVDEVVFFGDSHNDLPLFELFDNGFCVECGAADAKEVAQWVIPDPQDGGPAAVIRALARNKGNLSVALAELGL